MTIAETRAETLRAMARNNRIDAAHEGARGNILLARDLRERADDYERRANKLLEQIGEALAGFAMAFVFCVAAAWWIAL